MQEIARILPRTYRIIKSSDDPLHTLLPICGEEAGTRGVGMQIEFSGIAVLLVEEFGVVPESLESFFVSRKDTFAIGLCYLADDGVVGLQAVKACLKISRAVMGRGAVPNGEVQHDAGVRVAGEERIDNRAHILLILLRTHGGSVAPRLRAVVRAEHHGEHVLRFGGKQLVSRSNHRAETLPASRQPVVGGRTAPSTVGIFHVIPFLTQQLHGLRRRSLRFGMGQSGSLRNAVADEDNLHGFLSLRKGREGEKDKDKEKKGAFHKLNIEEHD